MCIAILHMFHIGDSPIVIMHCVQQFYDVLLSVKVPVVMLKAVVKSCAIGQHF